MMNVCTKCGSEKIRIIHTDSHITSTCLDCGHVEKERYGWRYRKEKQQDQQERQEEIT